MITGFNTDIEHDGVVYHVQTEDKGLDSPIILSLVYVGGTILASKRSPYADLIEQGFSDEVLSERLKRQHKLICAAINSGRINDLKKMGARAKQAPEIVPEEPIAVVETDVSEEVEAASTPPAIEEFEFDYEMTQQWTPPPPKEATEEEEERQIEEPADESSWEVVAEEEQTEEPLDEVLPDGLVITLLDDEEFYAAQAYTLRVLITNRAKGEENPLANAAVSIKILGTTFRPLIYTLKTESDGVATVATEIPEFSSGRAAVLVRAVVKDQAAELRRIIHPAA